MDNAALVIEFHDDKTLRDLLGTESAKGVFMLLLLYDAFGLCTEITFVERVINLGNTLCVASHCGADSLWPVHFARGSYRGALVVAEYNRRIFASNIASCFHGRWNIAVWSRIDVDTT
jgi:hypothetical protein